MKNYKKLTRSQKEFLQQNGYDPKNWYCIKNTSTCLEIISKQSLRTANRKTRIIYLKGGS